MSFLSELENIKSPTFIFTSVAILFALTPGATFIYYLNSRLFLELDTVKLIFLSLCFIAPFILINFLLIDSLLRNRTEEKNPLYAYIVFSVMISSLQLYGILILSYLNKTTDFEQVFKSLLYSVPVMAFMLAVLKYKTNAQ